MKRTPFMYGLGIAWKPLNAIEEDMFEKQLTSRVYPENFSRREQRKMGFDKRTRYLIELTMKGQYVLRWLDELLKYISEESGPNVRPPMWILRTLFRHRIEDYRSDLDPFTVMNRRLEVDVSGIRLSLMPPRMTGAKSIPCSFRVGSRSLIVRSSSAQLLGVFELSTERSKHRPPGLDTGPMFCPECGTKCLSLHGLKIHVGHTHRDKKDEIMSKINLFRERLGIKPDA